MGTYVKTRSAGKRWSTIQIETDFSLASYFFLEIYVFFFQSKSRKTVLRKTVVGSTG